MIKQQAAHQTTASNAAIPGRHEHGLRHIGRLTRRLGLRGLEQGWRSADDTAPDNHGDQNDGW